MRSFLLFVFAVISIITTIPGASADSYSYKTFYPVDEGQYMTSFKTFRDNLLSIVKEKNVNALLPLIDDDIKYSFGVENGKQSFIKYWELVQGKNTSQSNDFWKELEKVLKKGGNFDNEGNFSAPYYASNWPDGFDAFEYAAVTGEDVNVYKKEASGLKAFMTLSYKIVKYDNAESVKFNNYTYDEVTLPDGQKVYINQNYLGRPIDYRASFDRDKNGKWIMTLFICGD